MNDSQSWSHISARITDRTYFKTFAVSPKNSTRNKEKKKKRENGNCQVFLVVRKNKNFSPLPSFN